MGEALAVRGKYEGRGTDCTVHGVPRPTLAPGGMHRTPFRFWAVKGSRTTPPAIIQPKLLRGVSYGSTCHQ
jgi:hypothetical protein